MHVPKRYQVEDPELVVAFMKQYSFATLGKRRRCARCYAYPT